MQRINLNEIFIENIPAYGSNIIDKKTGGLGGEIFFNLGEIDFFDGDENDIEIDETGKSVIVLNTSNIYTFDRDNILDYLESVKNEFIYHVLNNYKIPKRQGDEWKSIDLEGWNKRKTLLEKADLRFNMYLKKSTEGRGFIGCNTSDIYSLVVAYTLIPNYTELRIKKEKNGGATVFTFYFALKDMDYTAEVDHLFEEEVSKQRNLDLSTLMNEAKKRGGASKKSKVQTTVYSRDPMVAAAVKNRANGVCDLCGKEAPFLTMQGFPFLEEHHVVRLADGGTDDLNNAVALCPNCHRKMHIVNDEKDTETLKQRILAYAKAMY